MENPSKNETLGQRLMFAGMAEIDSRTQYQKVDRIRKKAY